jgi:hypothetical protein
VHRLLLIIIILLLLTFLIVRFRIGWRDGLLGWLKFDHRLSFAIAELWKVRNE